jgi:heme exporter protein D
MGDEKYGFVVWIAFTVTLGVVYYAYSQAKMDIKYGSK